MFKISEAAKWNEQQCAEYIAREAEVMWTVPTAEDLTSAIRMAATDAWLESTGNLHAFAGRARHGEIGPLVKIKRAQFNEGPTLREQLQDQKAGA